MSKSPEQINAMLDDLMILCTKHDISPTCLTIEGVLDFIPQHPLVGAFRISDLKSKTHTNLSLEMPTLSAHEKMALLNEKKNDQR